MAGCGGAGELYAGGEFDTADGVAANYIARWSGTVWSPVPAGDGFMSREYCSTIRALALDNGGRLFAGGCFATAGDIPAHQIASWDGAAWYSLGGGMDDTVMALAADQAGNVFAGGFFHTAGTVNADYIAQWDGAAWSRTGRSMR